MDKQPQSRAPLIVAIVLLLLPVVYVVGYLALVKPEPGVLYRLEGDRPYYYGYRYFGSPLPASESYPREAKIAPAIFWPLEQIDRKVRPGAWE